jgi:tRNA-dihydrouridine synthase B
MKLGPLEIPTDLVLAPMMDVTTPSFRQLAKNLGGLGLIVTPMVFVQQIAVAPKTVIPHLELLEQQRPCAIQIVASGRNEDYMRVALDILNSYKFDLLDINSGCPATHTVRSGGGGSLLKDYCTENSVQRLQNVINWALKYAQQPVSLKTRLGFDTETDVLEISKIVQELGISMLTLHGRTVRQNYSGDANLEMIRRVKEQLNIPLIGNGDVHDFESYLTMKQTTGCDAVMIGRAAMHNPKIFAEIEYMKQNTAKQRQNITDQAQSRIEKTIALVREWIHQDLNIIEGLGKFWNTDRFKVAEIRRLAIWFIKGIPGYKYVRERLSKINQYPQLRNYIFGTEIETDFKDHALMQKNPKEKELDFDSEYQV